MKNPSWDFAFTGPAWKLAVGSLRTITRGGLFVLINQFKFMFTINQNDKRALSMVVPLILLLGGGYLLYTQYNTYSEAKSYCMDSVNFQPVDVFVKGEYYYYSDHSFGIRGKFKTKEEAFESCINYEKEYIKDLNY